MGDLTAEEKRREAGRLACRNWYHADPQRARARVARYKEKHPEKVRAQGVRQYASRRAAALIGAAKSRARKKGLPFNLSEHVAFYHALVEAGVCQLTGLPLSKQHGSPFAPSLDRIKPELGYVHGNVRVVLFAINMALGEWGETAYAKIAKAYVEKTRLPWEK